jgi:hypothetical protein
MIAVTVKVNNHCPAFLKLMAIYSWLPNNTVFMLCLYAVNIPLDREPAIGRNLLEYP